MLAREMASSSASVSCLAVVTRAWPDEADCVIDHPPTGLTRGAHEGRATFSLPMKSSLTTRRGQESATSALAVQLHRRLVAKPKSRILA